MMPHRGTVFYRRTTVPTASPPWGAWLCSPCDFATVCTRRRARATHRRLITVAGAREARTLGSRRPGRDATREVRTRGRHQRAPGSLSTASSARGPGGIRKGAWPQPRVGDPSQDRHNPRSDDAPVPPLPDNRSDPVNRSQVPEKRADTVGEF